MKELVEFLDKHGISRQDYEIKNGLLIFKVNYLILSHNNISVLPENFHLINVNNLILSNNNIKVIPENFHKIKVNTLDLSHNNISVIPEKFHLIKVNNLYLYNNNISVIPENFHLIKVNTLYLHNNNISFDIKHEKFKEFDLSEDYIFSDNILFHIKNKRDLGEILVFENFLDEFCVLDKKTNKTAHGKSLKSAILDLRFKLSDSDKTRYEGLDLDEKLEFEEIYIMYRILTGSCSLGIENFIEENKIERKKYSVREVSNLIRSSYDSQTFNQFFKL